MRGLFIGLVLATIAGSILSSNCCAGPTVLVGINVPAAQRVPVDKVNRSAWDNLLKKYVDANGYVTYAAWKASAADQKALDDYLNHLSAASFDRKSSREAQIAFWVNAYNAVTVKGILREYPTTSIRNHTAKVYGYNIWKDLQILVAGKAHSLEGIERSIAPYLPESARPLAKSGSVRVKFLDYDWNLNDQAMLRSEGRR